MNYLSNIFTQIQNDFLKHEYKNQKTLSRKFKFENDIIFIAYYNKVLQNKEIAIKIPNNYEINFVNKYPKWKGIDIIVSKIEFGADEGSYILFQQLQEYNTNIYDIVLEDLLINLKMLENNKNTLNIIAKILNKWKLFFDMQNDIVMTDIKQQGLFGELLFLEKLLSKYGDKALFFWSGCNAETHDFYISGSAVEVKTNSTNSSNGVTISNEYQLDNNDVSGNLYLMFIKLRKSNSDGEEIPIIVERILNKIIDQDIKKLFEEKLFMYCYLLRHPEIYKLKFSLREIHYFQVSDDFPKLTKSIVPKGISNVKYGLNLEMCDNFSITEEMLMDGLKELNYGY